MFTVTAWRSTRLRIAVAMTMTPPRRRVLGYRWAPGNVV